MSDLRADVQAWAVCMEAWLLQNQPRYIDHVAEEGELELLPDLLRLSRELLVAVEDLQAIVDDEDIEDHADTEDWELTELLVRDRLLRLSLAGAALLAWQRWYAGDPVADRLERKL